MQIFLQCLIYPEINPNYFCLGVYSYFQLSSQSIHFYESLFTDNQYLPPLTQPPSQFVHFNVAKISSYRLSLVLCFYPPKF